LPFACAKQNVASPEEVKSSLPNNDNASTEASNHSSQNNQPANQNSYDNSQAAAYRPQSELLSTDLDPGNSPLGKVDFLNFTYPLPRGWQHPDAKEVTLENGQKPPVFENITDDMDPEEKAVKKAERRIGLSYVATKYFDIDGDGVREAAVILKVETGGSAIPQIVYIYQWKNEKPELIWYFRTGDRADGGLKNIYVADGRLVIELFGQDRFIFGSVESGRITGDEEQLCCPSFFTKSRYRWNGKNFQLDGKRLTYSISDANQPPIENLGDKINQKNK
jgi:hypothetical protein